MIRRHTSSNVAAFDVPEPTLNVTPLIDVLLVLIVMLILTIPIMTHKIPVDLPTAAPPRTAPPVIVHRITISAAGTLGWDGVAIAPRDLPARLAVVVADPATALHIAADPATRYAVFAETLASIKRAGVTRLGFVGNERFASLG